MKKMINLIIYTLIVYINVFSFSITPDSLLMKMDKIVSPNGSKYMYVKLILIDKNNNQVIKEIKMYEKNNKRFGKFLKPAKDKGFGFLTMNDNEMYIYLPAYKTIKKISSNKKGGKFAGTDFTYEDMESGSFVKNYNCTILNEDSLYYYIKLTPKENKKSIYLYKEVKVDKNTFYPMEIKYFNKKSENVKTMTINKVEKIDNYLIATNSTMINHKTQHKTTMIIEEFKLNINIDDNIFTKRNLKE